MYISRFEVYVPGYPPGVLLASNFTGSYCPALSFSSRSA